MPTRISTPFLQRVDLRLVRHAAVDRQHPDAAGAARGGDVAGDLQAELAGRDDDQRLRLAVGALVGCSTRSSRGRPKPRVLPVPVGAWPIRSVPRRAIGSAYSWIAKARVMPAAASASTVSARTPSSAKVGLSGRTGCARGELCPALSSL